MTKVSLLLFVLILNSLNVQIENSDVNHSTIVEAKGFSYISENLTIAEIRELAFINAKRQALEKCQTHIKSLTIMENFQLSYDLVESDSEGLIRILDSKDFGIKEDNKYHVWIRAELQYNLKTNSDYKNSKIDQTANSPLTVSIWTEKKQYKTGERIKVLMQANKDFYARIIYFDASKNKLQILPNKYQRDSFFKGKKVYSIPDPLAPYYLEVFAPYGKEEIIVYASTAPLGEINLDDYNGFYKIEDEIADYSLKMRGVKILKKDKEDIPAEFYEDKISINTKE